MENQNSDNDQVLKKIKKLMALATSSNENEAKMAAEKAQELIVRHKLTVQQIEVYEEDYENIEAGKVSKVQREHSLIMGILTRYFFVRCYFEKSWAGTYTRGGRAQYVRTIRMVGTPSNVAVAKYVFEYLSDTYRRLWKQFKAEHKLSESAKYSYFIGLTEGIRDRLEAVKVKVENEMGLVVVDDVKLADHMSKMNLKNRSVQPLYRNQTVESHGYSHGQKVQIARAIDSDSENKGLSIGYKK
jgi:hypothetical protein